MPTVTIIKPTIETGSDRKIRAAAYCRVSSSSDDQINSYMAQMTYYTHKFENSETEILVDLYADEGISGTREDKRPEFQRLIKDCRKGKIDRIYTKSISRFARNTRDCLKNVRELKSLGISIFFEKENIDTANIADEMMITIMGGLAQEESVSISQNMQWSVQRRMKNGTYSPNSQPFGYRIVDKNLIVYEDEAKIVKDIFQYFINGHGTQSTADYINKKYDCKKKIAISSVRYILMNEKYVGDTLYQKYYTPNILGAHHCPNYGEKDKYYAENTHPAIISRETFDIAQKLLKERYIHRERKNDHIFTKKIQCSICGCNYVKRSCRDIRYWVCVKHNRKASLCASSQIPEQKIKNAFVCLYNKLLCNYKQIIIPVCENLYELRCSKYKSNSMIISIRHNMAKLKEQSHVLATLRTKGFLSEEKYQEQTAELNRKISKLQKELKMLTKSDDEDETLEQIDMLVEYFESREQLMIEFEEKAFEFLVDRIVVNQNELEFHLLGGLKFTEKI